MWSAPRRLRPLGYPQPRRGHQPAHLDLLHWQRGAQFAGDAARLQAEQRRGEAQAGGLDHLLAVHLTAAHHFHLLRVAQHPAEAQQGVARRSGDSREYHQSPEIAQAFLVPLLADLAAAFGPGGHGHSSQRDLAISS